MGECLVLTLTSSITKRSSVHTTSRRRWIRPWIWILSADPITCQCFLSGHHHCGRRHCSKDTRSHRSPGQSQIPTLPLNLPLQARAVTRADSECRSIVFCLLCPATVLSLPKAAFQMHQLIPYLNKVQSRMSQATHRNRSGTLCLGPLANPRQIRAWQKIRLYIFPYGSLKSGEQSSISQSRSPWAVHDQLLMMASRPARPLQVHLSRLLKITSWSNLYLRHSCRLV